MPHHSYLGEGLTPALVEPAQVALHLPQRLPPLGLRLRPDQVPQPLGRRQVQLPTVEGSARELPGLGRTQPGQAPCQSRGEPPSPSWGHPPAAPRRPGPEGRGGGETGGASPSARSTPLTTAGPPCTCSSAQSSPVKLWGPAEPGHSLYGHRLSPPLRASSRPDPAHPIPSPPVAACMLRPHRGFWGAPERPSASSRAAAIYDQCKEARVEPGPPPLASALSRIHGAREAKRG